MYLNCLEPLNALSVHVHIVILIILCLKLSSVDFYILNLHVHVPQIYPLNIGSWKELDTQKKFYNIMIALVVLVLCTVPIPGSEYTYACTMYVHFSWSKLTQELQKGFYMYLRGRGYWGMLYKPPTSWGTPEAIVASGLVGLNRKNPCGVGHPSCWARLNACFARYWLWSWSLPPLFLSLVISVQM